jgi:RNA polymerase sigma factor (TIGR02999 family)
VPGGLLTSKPTWSNTFGFSTTSAFLVSASRGGGYQPTTPTTAHQLAAFCTPPSTDLATALVRIMHDMTRVLNAIHEGDPHAAEQLLPLVYEELRKLAAQKMAQEAPGQTLQATALVNEAYLRLVDVEKAQRWDSRRHFFAAAAEAMRRILVEAARRKQRLKNGGGRVREPEPRDIACPERPERMLALDEALGRLATANPQAAELVKLRYFAGFSSAEAADFLGISPRKANQVWAYARAWLREELGDDQEA